MDVSDGDDRGIEENDGVVWEGAGRFEDGLMMTPAERLNVAGRWQGWAVVEMRRRDRAASSRFEVPVVMRANGLMIKTKSNGQQLARGHYSEAQGVRRCGKCPSSVSGMAWEKMKILGSL